jgi:hypothetical protein
MANSACLYLASLAAIATTVIWQQLAMAQNLRNSVLLRNKIKNYIIINRYQLAVA